MAAISYLPGDKYEYTMEVHYIVNDSGCVPKNEGGFCAFCNGDPCNEEPDGGSDNIRLFYQRNPAAATCPCCDGRPS